MGRPIVFIAIIAVGWLLYKLYFQKLLKQGTPGKVKIGLIALGLVFLGLAMTGKAPALFAIIGAAMTQIMRIAPLLIRFAPSLGKLLGTGALGAAASRASGAGVSRVNTATIAMTMEHSAGVVDGEVLLGPFQGRILSSLSVDELKSLYVQCQQNDPDALRLLATYVQKERSSEWTFETGDDQDSAAGGQRNASSSGMNATEAGAILGVDENASKEEIIEAHRSLMGRLHPDKGGSNYLAAKVNAAKQVLLDKVS